MGEKREDWSLNSTSAHPETRTDQTGLAQRTSQEQPAPARPSQLMFTSLWSELISMAHRSNSLVLFPLLLIATSFASVGSSQVASGCAEVKESSMAALSPVCGSDGKTYLGENALRCANEGSDTKVVFKGACEDPCWQAIQPDATQINNPTCATDGVLYPNELIFTCVKKSSGTDALNVTTCSPDPKPFDPCVLLAYVATRSVCGSDNVTYNNIWHLICTANTYHVDDLKIKHEGSCNIECPYSPIYDPVCSSDEYMFANIEAFQCQRILRPYIRNAIHQRGPCFRYSKQNPCYVNNAYNAVCASNGRTYSNPQHVRCLKQFNPDIRIQHSGPCLVSEVVSILGEERACALAADYYEWNPICGSDNVTYGNPYRFLCEKLRGNQTDLTVSFFGECDAFSYCHLLNEGGEKACGNDGVTYSTLHHLYCAQGTNRHLQLKHAGTCTESDDPCLFRGDSQNGFLENSGLPVCATDGKTYVSPQAVWCASKTKKEIQFSHDGECI